MDHAPNAMPERRSPFSKRRAPASTAPVQSSASGSSVMTMPESRWTRGRLTSKASGGTGPTPRPRAARCTRARRPAATAQVKLTALAVPTPKTTIQAPRPT